MFENIGGATSQIGPRSLNSSERESLRPATLCDEEVWAIREKYTSPYALQSALRSFTVTSVRRG
jgi:hypothetical protein